MEEQKHIQKTYKADIYVGLKEGYDGYVADMDDVLAFVKKICNGFKIGVTLTTETNASFARSVDCIRVPNYRPAFGGKTTYV